MDQPFGGFTDEALEAYQKAVAEKEGVEFSEEGTYDFTTCIRPDGSAYGTGGTCRKGTEGEARKQARTDMVKQRHEVAQLNKAREEAAAGGDKKAAADARRQHIDAKNKLKELMRRHEDLRKESGDIRRFGAEMNRYKATDDELKAALDSGKLSAKTAEKVRIELAQRKAFGVSKEEATKKTEQSTADKAMETVKASNKAGKGMTQASDLASQHAKEMGVSKGRLEKVYDRLLKKNPDTDLGDLYQKAQSTLKGGTSKEAVKTAGGRKRRATAEAKAAAKAAVREAAAAKRSASAARSRFLKEELDKVRDKMRGATPEVQNRLLQEASAAADRRAQGG
jgi:hypothetical protein